MILYYIILYYFILYYNILYYIMLYYIVLCYIILCKVGDIKGGHGPCFWLNHPGKSRRQNLGL